MRIGADQEDVRLDQAFLRKDDVADACAGVGSWGQEGMRKFLLLNELGHNLGHLGRTVILPDEGDLEGMVNRY